MVDEKQMADIKEGLDHLTSDKMVREVGCIKRLFSEVMEQPIVIKRPARDACLCMGDLQAPPAPHFVFLITL